MSDEAPTLDLSAFDFGPAWAKDPSSQPAPAARPFREDRPPREGRDFRGPRPDRRPGGQGRPPHQGPRNGGPGSRRPQDRRKFDAPRRDERPEPPPNPFPWLRFAFTATEPAVETVAKQIRHTGKTFSLFDLARILLRNPASFTIDLFSAPPPPAGPFYIVPSDGSVWMSMANAARHLLSGRLEEFYRCETLEIDPPKGNFPVVAVCGMSGTLIGPPNHHDFERRLRELHRERFARMDFDQLRSRLKMERNPDLVEKWKAESSRVTVYYPREGEDAPKLPDLAAVEKHFLAQHAAALVEFVPTARVSGDPKKARVDAALFPLLQHVRDEETRFPLRLAQNLSRALTAAGLRFHKSANRTTYVSASRPRHLNLEEVPISDALRRILETIRNQKNLRRPRLLDILAPLPPAEKAPAPPAVDAPPAPVTPPVAANEPPSEVIPPAAPSVVETVPPAEPVSAAAPAEPAPAPPVAPPSPAQVAREAVVNDLLWLTHEGYVIEYADGRLESVPPPKNPPKPTPSPDATAAPAASSEVTAPDTEVSPPITPPTPPAPGVPS